MQDALRAPVEGYLEAFCRGDYETMAGWIDPQDRVDFQKHTLAAVRILDEVGFDNGLRQAFAGRSLRELSDLSPQQFLALFLRQSMGGETPPGARILKVRQLDEQRALAHYRVAGQNGELEMRLAPYGWKIRLRQNMGDLGAVVERLTADFSARAARDRPLSAEVPLTPFALYGYRGPEGQTVIEPRFERAEEFSDGLALVYAMGRYGYIDHTGRVKISIRWTRATSFAERRAFVAELTPELDQHYALIDTEGRQLTTFRFHQARPFSEGLAEVAVKGLWGYVDLDGDWVVEPQFCETEPYHGGRAWVSHPEHGEYYINRAGRRLKSGRHR